MEKNSISKRANHRKFYLPYTNIMEQELVENVSSMDGISKIKMVESNTTPSKCLLFERNNLTFEISIFSKMWSYYRYYSKYEFGYRRCRNKALKPIWYINASLGFYSPLDIVEIVNIVYNLYISYQRETINEMKTMAIKYDLGYVGVYYGDAENDKLTQLFMLDHHIDNDKYGITYYYIDYLSQEALYELEDEKWVNDD